jgi:hypothetical protein
VIASGDAQNEPAWVVSLIHATQTRSARSRLQMSAFRTEKTNGNTIFQNLVKVLLKTQQLVVFGLELQQHMILKVMMG